MSLFTAINVSLYLPVLSRALFNLSRCYGGFWFLTKLFILYKYILTYNDVHLHWLFNRINAQYLKLLVNDLPLISQRVNTLLIISEGLCTSYIIIRCNVNAKNTIDCSKSITTTTLSLMQNSTCFLSEYDRKYSAKHFLNWIY